MRAEQATSLLRDKLGDDTTYALFELLESEHSTWSERVLNVAAERFERRLTEEIAGLRVTMIREIHEARIETLRWGFLFWIGQVAAITGFLAFLLRAR